MVFPASSSEVERKRDVYIKNARAFIAHIDFLDKTKAERIIPWQIRYAQQYMAPLIDDIFDAPQLKEK